MAVKSTQAMLASSFPIYPQSLALMTIVPLKFIWKGSLVILYFQMPRAVQQLLLVVLATGDYLLGFSFPCLFFHDSVPLFYFVWLFLFCFILCCAVYSPSPLWPLPFLTFILTQNHSQVLSLVSYSSYWEIGSTLIILTLTYRPTIATSICQL